MATVIDKSVKYDRQLRLWAQKGQYRLEQSHVCLINATPTGAEVLKNLTLPGIGTFTIVDERTVSEDDLSGNFYLTEADMNKSISERMAFHISELNPDVKAYGIVSSLCHCLSRQGFFDTFDVVLVSDYIPIKLLLALREKLWLRNVPLVHVNTRGLYGTLQISREETVVIETHDPSKMYDLRIDQPWQELQDYANSFSLDDLDDIEHAHVPYIVIFIKGIERWKNDHHGLLPKTHDEKKLFKTKYIEAMARNLNSEGNFVEASQQVHRALQRTVVPEYLYELFQDDKMSEKVSDCEGSNFWLLLRALKLFVASHGVLPLPGDLPDMTSNTSNYVALQRLYCKKSSDDLHEFTRLLTLVLNECDVPIHIPGEQIAAFCKNAAILHYTKGSLSLASESLKEKMITGGAASYTIAIHMGIQALLVWEDENSVGGYDKYLKHFTDLIKPFEIEQVPENCRQILLEIFCHRSTNYHNICSIMGGIASQEILKIVTAQYIPLDNLIIYDGIRTISEKWKS